MMKPLKREEEEIRRRLSTDTKTTTLEMLRGQIQAAEAEEDRGLIRLLKDLSAEGRPGELSLLTTKELRRLMSQVGMHYAGLSKEEIVQLLHRKVLSQRTRPQNDRQDEVMDKLTAPWNASILRCLREAIDECKQTPTEYPLKVLDLVQILKKRTVEAEGRVRSLSIKDLELLRVDELR